MTRRAIVVGAGFGGLALAIRLQSAGVATTIVEARDTPGGRAYHWKRDGFTFDAGPTVITDPPCLQELWALGGQDIDAPAGETARRIKGLIAEGRPITLAVFPKAEHGMTEFETAPDGSRVSTRFTPGYFRLLIDYARGAPLDPAYGDAEITRPATTK